MTDQALADHRALKDGFFANDPHSPLRIEDRASFRGLTYFEEDPALAFTVTPNLVEPEEVAIATTTGDERTYVKVATVGISIEGNDVALALYSTGHPGFFLPFRDATSGTETYGAGRYLDLDPNPDGTITIDFNYAYAPFCAYNEAYSCALPPVEDWLDVPIRAGERQPAEAG